MKSTGWKGAEDGARAWAICWTIHTQSSLLLHALRRRKIITLGGHAARRLAIDLDGRDDSLTMVIWGKRGWMCVWSHMRPTCVMQQRRFQRDTRCIGSSRGRLSEAKTLPFASPWKKENGGLVQIVPQDLLPWWHLVVDVIVPTPCGHCL